MYYGGFCPSYQILCIRMNYNTTSNALLTMRYMVGDQKMLNE